MEKDNIKNKLKYLDPIYDLQNLFSNHLIKVSFGKKVDGLSLNDTHSGRVIGEHYSLSHYAAGLILLSRTTGNKTLLKPFGQILNFIEHTNHKYFQRPDYHYDFNNFSWSILLLLEIRTPGFLPTTFFSRISSLLLETPDSKNDTINWFPMRALNNFARYNLCGDRKFYDRAVSLLLKVSSAQSIDGMFDDLLPIGLSGSIQYHVFTTAVLQLIKNFEFSDQGGDLHSALNFILNIIDPEGDFNYFGRGTNQLFGWGPFLFILEGTVLPALTRNRCVDFFLENLNSCLKNNSLLLKNSTSNQYIFWWDYNYCSVYYAHLFFWLNLINVVPLHQTEINYQSRTKNVEILSSDKIFCSKFNGKSYYLCERGPQICNIWTKNSGSIFKGPFGPFYDNFGNNTISKISVLLNYFGPIVEYPEKIFFRINSILFTKIVQKFIRKTQSKFDCGAILKPIFPTRLNQRLLDNGTVEITYKLKKYFFPISFNIPLFHSINVQGEIDFVNIFFDGEKVKLHNIGAVYGFYGKNEIFRTLPKYGVRHIKVIIRQIK